ncbi:hypothetical protein [Streptosporangium sp. KLBMP 9127]|nr:hypothetical protein [Streptosporangium sp. KLBMP 9127]
MQVPWRHRRVLSEAEKKAARQRTDTRYLWALFVLSFATACLEWRRGEEEFAVLAGSCSLLAAVVIVGQHYGRHPR